jgi:hypothetical protein
MTEQQAEYSADSVIRFQAQVFKAQTLIDGGWRVSFDGSGNLEAFLKLVQAQQPGVMLEVVAVAVDNKKNKQQTNGKSELDERQKRKSRWKAEEG